VRDTHALSGTKGTRVPVPSTHTSKQGSQHLYSSQRWVTRGIEVSVGRRESQQREGGQGRRQGGGKGRGKAARGRGMAQPEARPRHSLMTSLEGAWSAPAERHDANVPETLHWEPPTRAESRRSWRCLPPMLQGPRAWCALGFFLETPLAMAWCQTVQDGGRGGAQGERAG
jgi:hypothetical protein